jgi:hypothetical protein
MVLKCHVKRKKRDDIMPKRKGVYYVAKDVGRIGHHYLLMRYKGKRGKGKFLGSELKTYKKKKR